MLETSPRIIAETLIEIGGIASQLRLQLESEKDYRKDAERKASEWQTMYESTYKNKKELAVRVDELERKEFSKLNRIVDLEKDITLRDAIIDGLIKDYKIKGARLIKIRKILKPETNKCNYNAYCPRPTAR